MKHRLRRLATILGLLLGLLALRLFQLQMLLGARYARLSDRNRIREIVLPGPRGRIFDRDGRVIAETRPSFTCTVIPTELGDSTLYLLAPVISLPESVLRARIAPVARYTAPVSVKRNLTTNELARLEENNFRLPGVHVRIDPLRSYPKGRPYCHLLGHLGEVSDPELDRDTALRRLDLVGRSGIEAQYEYLLRGRNGHEYVEVDARGQELGPLREGGYEPPVPGRDLHLAVSDRIQTLATRLVSEYARAAVVGLDARTGGVICLVSQPGFDANLLLEGITTRAWDSLVANPSKPFFNRATSSSYPPGSTLKPLVALGALSRRLISTDTRFQPCTGRYKYGNRHFRCTGAHGSLGLIPAIAYSCNSYFYQLALRIGIDSLAGYVRGLGLGSLTGIDLPAEKPGSVPTRAWLDSRYGAGRWGAGSLLNFAIGQGEVAATPLQMACAFAALGTDGGLCPPHVLDHVDSAGRTIWAAPATRSRSAFARPDLHSIQTALSRVVEYGTAAKVRLREVTIAGKTGTAQNPPRPDHAWFVGYAPAGDPEVVFAVVVENAGHGGAVAAPIASRLIRAWFFPDEDRPQGAAAALGPAAQSETTATDSE